MSVGQAQQRAQFADGTVFNEVGLFSQGMWINLSADLNPVDVNIFYVSAKTTDSGSTPGTVTLISTQHVNANQTARFPINLGHAAFAGNYGAVVLDSIGSSPQDVFQAYLMSGTDIWSVGGSVFNGGSFRVPYWATTNKIALAVTNTSDFAFNITFQNLGGGNQFKTINLPVMSTYLFDSAASGWGTQNVVGSVQVTTTNGGTIVISGYETRTAGSTQYRVYPVKAAPYFCQ